MPYILQKGNEYCLINNKKAIDKTQNPNLATVFDSHEEADQQLNRATKKLAGFKVICLTKSETSKVSVSRFKPHR